MRIYDPRLARFLSVDPLTKNYPSWSPYPFAMNRPIDGVDLDGLEFFPAKNLEYRKFTMQARVTKYGDIIVEKKPIGSFSSPNGKEVDFGKYWEAGTELNDVGKEAYESKATENPIFNGASKFQKGINAISIALVPFEAYQEGAALGKANGESIDADITRREERRASWVQDVVNTAINSGLVKVPNAQYAEDLANYSYDGKSPAFNDKLTIFENNDYMDKIKADFRKIESAINKENKVNVQSSTTMDNYNTTYIMDNKPIVK